MPTVTNSWHSRHEDVWRSTLLPQLPGGYPEKGLKKETNNLLLGIGPSHSGTYRAEIGVRQYEGPFIASTCPLQRRPTR
jgi:hypothetical protein